MPNGCRTAVLLCAALWLAPLEAVAQTQPDPAPPVVQYPNLRISGFADVNYDTSNDSKTDRGFALGQLALHMISELSTRVTFFGEVTFTPRGDAGTGSPSAAGFNAEVERLILRFDQSDQLQVSFGRYHTPINYWNTAFHHGQWLQTTITRPEMIRFGSQLLPVHFVGGLAEGALPAGGWNLNYRVGVGNGRAGVISRAGDAGDSNDARAWLAAAFIKPDPLYGLEAGGAVYGDTVTTSAGRDVDERIVSAHVVWHRETPEIIAEVASVRHEDPTTGRTTSSEAYYVQLAYLLPDAPYGLKPYVRFEHIGIDAGDQVLAQVPELDMATLGLRAELSDFAAAKGEFRTWTRGSGSDRRHGLFLQLAFTF